jgi:hypothetical protein
MSRTPVTRTATSAMTKEAALKLVLLVLPAGTIKGEHAWLALEQGGCKKVSDLKEIIFEDLEKLVHAMRTAAPTATCHLNTLQRRKMSLIPLWCQVKTRMFMNHQHGSI